MIVTAVSLLALGQASPSKTDDIAVVATKEATVQMTEVSGTVIDNATKTPVQGAIIQVTGNSRYSAMTGEDGRFSINVPVCYEQLTCNVPGYNSTQTRIPEKGEKLLFKMYPDNFKNDYQDRARVVNSNASSMNDYSSALTVEDALSSTLGADARILQHSANPAQGSALFIGGFNSLFVNSQPLIVVDGVIWDTQNDRTVLHDGYYNNVLSAISVNDIEKVTVLKNATALYGSKGGNGVILIETKRSKSMATRINVNLSTGLETMPNLPDMMNASQYRSYATDLIGNMNVSADFLDDYTTDKKKYNTYHNNTDWKDYTYRYAWTQKYEINVQGCDNVAGYNLSIGYVDAQSTLQSNDFSRLNMRFNTDVSISDNFTSKLDVAYSNTIRDLRDDGVASDYSSSTVYAPGYLALIKSPLLNPYEYDNDGSLTGTLVDEDEYFNLANPVSIQENGEASNKNRLKYTLFSLNLTPKWQLNKSLFVSEQFSYLLNNVTERYFVPDEGVSTITVDGYEDINNTSKAMSSQQSSLFSDTRIDWNKNLKANGFHLFGGFRYQSDDYSQDCIEVNNTTSDKMPNITSTSDNREVSGVDEEWKSTALYVNMDYDYAEKYFLQGTLNAETSTRFGENANGGIKLGNYVWGLFPSIQGAWVISTEPFFQHIHFIDYLKLNIGFDQSGNDDIDCFASRSYFSSETFMNSTSGLYLANIGNDQLKWEMNSRYTTGLDVNLLNNRIGLTANFFYSKIDDLLTYKSLSGISGLSNYLCNEGSQENIGYDVSVRVKMINSKNFQWELGASTGHYRNKITSLPEDSYITSAYGAEILTQVGSPAGVFYGYETDESTVFSTTEEALAANLTDGSTGEQFSAGDVHFADQDENNVIDEKDKVIIGDPNPDLYGNIYSQFGFKNWSLYAVFNYSLGNDIYNYQRSQLESGSTYYNQTTALIDRWTYEGQVTNIPRVEEGDPMGNSRFSDRWIEDGSYLRLKTVTLSYQIPIQSTYIQGITLWATANNLITWTHYLGSDPEVSMSNSVLYQGIDRGLLAPGRSCTLGVKINL